MSIHDRNQSLLRRSYKAKRLCAITFLLASATSVSAAPVSFTVRDSSGAPFSKVLVIVKSLYNNNESMRALTDEHGSTNQVDLSSGAYRVIATLPYSLWKTQVQEFAVGQERVNLTLTLQVMGSQDDVAYVGARIQPIQVRTRTGDPVANATVIARDIYADHEIRYKTDEGGQANVALIADPTVIVVVSLPYITEHKIKTDNANQAKLARITFEIP